MNLLMVRPGLKSLMSFLGGLVLLCSSCVKQSEYDQVVNEKNDLESRLATAVQELQQANVQLQAQQARVYNLLNIQSTLQKRDQELQTAREELQELKAEFDKFRTERRNAMLGKKIPYLYLDDGRTLKDAEVSAIGPLELAIRHEGGILKLALADTNDDLRWEACFDPNYAQKVERDRFLAEARQMDAELSEQRMRPPPAPTMAAPTRDKSAAAQELRRLIDSQRAELNREYNAMQARNPAAFHGVSWDSTRPEASALLNSLSGRRAVLGMSRLEMIRDVINDNLIRLRNYESASR